MMMRNFKIVLSLIFVYTCQSLQLAFADDPNLYVETLEGPSDASLQLYESFLKKESLTPLDRAILSYNMTEVKRLVEKERAPLNPPDTKNGFPLIYAVIANSSEIVEYLLQKGAKVDGEFAGGATPLLMAIHWNLGNITKILIKYKANINKITQGLAPLDVAEQANFFEIALLLRDAGAKSVRIPEKATRPLEKSAPHQSSPRAELSKKTTSNGD